MNTELQTDIKEFAIFEIIKFVESWKTDSYIPLPSTWAEKNRYLPAGQTELPGLIDHSVAPHLVEIQDCFHPDSGVSQITIMKSTQSLATTTLENVIGHSIKYKLHNILYIISSLKMAKIRSSAAIDVMIDNSGLSNFIKPISTRMKRKLADSSFYKEMHGNRRLMMTSWNSIGDAKSVSWDLIIMDEIDEAPYELKGQGDPEEIFADRGLTIRDLKIAKLSTPTNTTGRINVNFLKGDQRFFNCKCPYCGERQVLKLKAAGRDYGLMAKTEKIDGVEVIIKDTVRYICKFCKKPIPEHQKGFMLENGIWIPTATAVNPEYRSYHISNLISPIMFFGWDKVMQKFAETDYGQNITKFKSFTINILGEPWESRSEKKNWTELKDMAENYRLQEIPEGGLIVCGGADIQKNRIELQVVAFGRNLESWIIDYQIFYGMTNDKNSMSWHGLKNYIKTKKYKIRKKELPIIMTAIDSGYNPNNEKDLNNTDITTEHIVYEFVATNPRTIASRGNAKLKDMILKQERIRRKSLLKIRYDLAVSELKDEVFTKLDMVENSAGKIHFSKFLPDEYFRGFVSESFAETSPGKWEWKKDYERNEPLDTYILARGAAEWVNIPTWGEEAWAVYERNLFI